MKIICLVKFVPDVENFTYDYDKNVLVRENTRLIPNPEDACALALALKMKEKNPDTSIEIVTMAPVGIIPLLEELLRRGIDKAALISDKLFAGSDTYATSTVLGRYLDKIEYDLILTGTHTLDGDTAHVPSQVAELLGIGQLSNVVKVFGDGPVRETVTVLVECDKAFQKYEMELPCVLSIGKESKFKLPFVKYKDLELDVRDRITILTNGELGFHETEVGLAGSLTKVNRTFTKQLDKKEKTVVQNDEEGIETVYRFLKDKGFV